MPLYSPWPGDEPVDKDTVFKAADSACLFTYECVLATFNAR